MRALNRKPDLSTITFWENAFAKGGKTMSDLITVLINTPEYRNRMQSKYMTLLTEIVGVDEYVDELNFDRFFKSFESSITIITESDMIFYIKKSDQFVNKTRKIVELIFNSKLKRDPSNEELGTFITKFQNLTDYSISNLESDIASNKDHTDVNTNTNTEKVLMFSFDCEFVKSFEDIFDRPIYIQEYVKYFLDRKDMDVSALHNKHIQRFHEIHSLLQRYMNTNISEHRFVCKFLDHMENPSFVDEFAKAIVLDDIYIKLMKQNIVRKYEALYDETLEDIDADYIFRKVQADKIELNDPNLDNFLLNFKGESDDIIRRIMDVFGRVYERTPDRSELINNAVLYRQAGYVGRTFDEVSVDLERDLMMCLEFHDIIKKKIKSLKPDIGTSQMFKTLKTVTDEVLPKATTLIILWENLANLITC